MAGWRVATASDFKHRAQVQSRKPAEHSMVRLPEETVEILSSHVGRVRRAAKAKTLESQLGLAAEDTEGLREKTAYSQPTA